jgi:hypothetical protein
MPQLQQWHGPLNRNNSCCFRRIKQEDDNQSNVTFEGIDVVDDFGTMIPNPSGEADPLPLPAGSAQASNTTVPLGTAMSLLVDDVFARMSPNTPVEDALLDLYLILSKARSPLYLFHEVVGFVEKHAGHTFQKGVTLPH